MTSANRQKERIYKVLRFCITGTIAAVFYFTLLSVMVELLGLAVLTATAIAYPIVTVENYLMHHIWTFKSTERHSAAFPKYAVSVIAGFFINWGIMYLGVEYLGWNYLLVQALSFGVILVLNLLVGALWVFGNQARST
jgi:putative flippase GtrA